MFIEDARAKIVNNLGIITGLESTPENAAIMATVVDRIVEIVVSDPPVGIENALDGLQGLTKPQATKVLALLELFDEILVIKEELEVIKEMRE